MCLTGSLTGDVSCYRARASGHESLVTPLDDTCTSWSARSLNVTTSTRISRHRHSHTGTDQQRHLVVLFVFLAPAKKLLTQKNSGGIIFGAIATILRNQLRKKILREIFSKELRKFRVTQHGRVCCLSSHQLHKIILGELIS